MQTTTVSISEAKQRLGEIADRAIEGEHIVIVRKSKLLVLKPLELPEPSRCDRPDILRTVTTEKRQKNPTGSLPTRSGKS